MHIIRALVTAAIILSATPVAAQDAPPEGAKHRRNVAQVRIAGGAYYGNYGRFIHGRPYVGLPVIRPRVWWVVDEFVEQGRPLGFSAAAYGYSSYGGPQPAWTGWPYNTGGRDVAPRIPSTPKSEAESAIAEGRAKWKAGDYAGALAGFKKAVASDLTSGSARLHMGLALLATGDLSNADKAVASALDHLRGPEEVAAMSLEAFRNQKERAKFEAKLVPAKNGSGSLAVALAQHLVGLKAKAAALLNGMKDPSGGKLLAILVLADRRDAGR